MSFKRVMHRQPMVQNAVIDKATEHMKASGTDPETPAAARTIQKISDAAVSQIGQIGVKAEEAAQEQK